MTKDAGQGAALTRGVDNATADDAAGVNVGEVRSIPDERGTMNKQQLYTFGGHLLSSLGVKQFVTPSAKRTAPPATTTDSATSQNTTSTSALRRPTPAPAVNNGDE